jgi:branched-chain amino acid transport system substrate-binding protein
MNKKHIFITVILTLSIIVSGCGPSAKQATPMTSAAGTAIPMANGTSKVQDTTCSDQIGCIKIGPTDPIHIAYLLVVSGPNAAFGVDSRNGVEIAIDDAGGIILGHTIMFDGQDGLCTTDGGQAAGIKLASDPTIVAVIGTSCSTEAMGAVPLLSKAGFVTISPSNTAPNLTDPASPNHYPGYFRIAFSDSAQGAAAADFAYNFLHLTKAATIQGGDSYSSSLVQAFADEFKQLGGTITFQASITNGQNDKSSLLASIANGSPDMIYFPLFMPEGALIIQQARSTPGLENTKLMGADGLFTPDVMKTTGASIEGFMVSMPSVGVTEDNAFVAKYVAKFSEQPLNNFHEQAYDAFNIAKAAIEKVAVQESDGTIYIGRQALRDAVATTTNFQGLTGILTCNLSGFCAKPVVDVYEYQTGKYPPTLLWSSKP